MLEGRMGALLGDEVGGSAAARPRALGELAARYGLEVRPESIPGLLERFGLRIAG